MYFISKLATALLAPLGTALLVAAVAVLCVALGRRRLAVGLGAAALAWLWLWATPAVGTALLLRLEATHPPQPLAAVSAAAAAVVLGGAISPPTATRPFANLHEAADRVWHAARLHHAGKAPLLVLAGGSDPARTAMSEAQAMQTLLLDLGVPASALLLEDRSRTTHENAQNSAALLRQRGIQRVLLVTSALHMPRAVAHFEAAGLVVVPAATDHTAPLVLGSWQSWVPDAGALADSGRGLKEVVGRWVVGPTARHSPS
jgi:uncharacterized SAM-binding protein YcdF (DUF218 family)